MTNVDIVAKQCELLNLKITESDKLFNNLPLKTYREWNRYGYQVKKGEKAIACFQIWKLTKSKSKKAESTNDQDENAEKSVTGKDRFRLVYAYFFSNEQVEPVED